MDVPNLDCMDRDELLAFHIANIRSLHLQNRQRAIYAWHKAKAIELRLGGFIADALAEEKICDRIYNQLPQTARW